MVMDYVRGGNLREYLQRNNHKLDFKKKLIQLHSIAEGLSTIHQQGLIHKDFHSGNILSGGYGSFFADLKCYITDLGLSRPANEKGDTNIYGVMPYVAPEVLKGKKYTQKSDIYSLGMAAYEILVGHPPFFNQAYSTSLATKICRGLRPKFQIKIPQLLEELINQC
jgi:serine/threonine protein kinase